MKKEEKYLSGYSSYLELRFPNTACWVKISADDKVLIFILLFLENRIRHFMQIVSLGDNLHEVSKPIF